MRLTLVRTGGVGGIRREAKLDAADLTPKQAAAVRDCVEKLHAEQAARRSQPRGRERDRFHYALTLEEADTCRTIAFREGEEPPALRSLLAVLEAPAHRKGGGHQ
ncbi:MAG: protealysin inhibitor emfourin [Thermoanaerobaculia bacterium]